MVGWVNIRRERNGAPIISVDGKVIKGAKSSRHDDPLFLVSAFEVEQGLVLTHRPCKGKGTEIQAVREMIDTLDITGCLLTAGALHCHEDVILKEVAYSHEDDHSFSPKLIACSHEDDHSFSPKLIACSHHSFSPKLIACSHEDDHSFSPKLIACSHRC